MTKFPAIIEEHRAEILELAAKYGAYNVRVFGSMARGDSDEASDIDLLVDFESGRTLFDQGGLLIELQKLLGHPVDVVTADGLRPRMQETVLKEAVPL